MSRVYYFLTIFFVFFPPSLLFPPVRPPFLPSFPLLFIPSPPPPPSSFSFGWSFPPFPPPRLAVRYLFLSLLFPQHPIFLDMKTTHRETGQTYWPPEICKRIQKKHAVFTPKEIAAHSRKESSSTLQLYINWSGSTECATDESQMTQSGSTWFNITLHHFRFTL